MRERHPSVLIAEDEYIFAAALEAWVEDCNMRPLGPVSSVRAAQELLESFDKPDAAILDINLLGEMVYPVAETLHARDVPFIFVTGCGCSLPPMFHDVPLLSKPATEYQILPVLHRIMRRGGSWQSDDDRGIFHAI